MKLRHGHAAATKIVILFMPHGHIDIRIVIANCQGGLTSVCLLLLLVTLNTPCAHPLAGKALKH